MEPWHQIREVERLPTPALVIYPDRVRENIRQAIHLAGGPKRLRPHIKTHKMSAVVRMHLELGVSKFKCATIAEAEMAADAGARDILVATQLAGANLARLRELRERFPEAVFSVICDNPKTATELNALGGDLPVYLDVDCGQGRTGLPAAEAPGLAAEIARQPNLRLAGLHVYDGHIHDPDPDARARQCEEAFAPMESLRQSLGPLELVAGGTPTFPMHARHPERVCSPGTYVFWDFGYQQFSDLPFQIAALVLARVISKPGPGRLTLDLGYKAVASENPPPRVRFLELSEARAIMHNEEHLVLETAEAERWEVGSVLYGLPRHICPTVALHDECFPIINGVAEPAWRIEARRRRITI